MNQRLKEDKQWSLVVVVDPEFLPGKSIYDMIMVISKAVSFQFIVLGDIEGICKNWEIYNLKKKENEIQELSHIFKCMLKVLQFDWGNFYLFQDKPEHWKYEGLMPEELMIQSDTTVRAVDDTYIYVYTPYESIVNAIQESYVVESIKCDDLEKLDYPE